MKGAGCMFTDLFKLYSSASKNTPKEDFTTEAFLGVLAVDPARVDAFVNEVLKVVGSGFSVETQKSYPGSIVDMVFYSKSSETLIFLENKVDSSEGDGQLAKYAALLNDPQYHSEKKVTKVFLGYCTRFLDVKSESDYFPLNFQQFRSFQWKDIYHFISLNPLFANEYVASSFLEYLEFNEMSRASDFNLDDLVAMRAFPDTLKIMRECCDRVTPKFVELFGATKSITNSHVIKHLTWWNRFALSSEDLFSEGYAEVLACFLLGNDKFDKPTVCALLYVGRDHPDFDSIVASMKAYSFDQKYLEEMFISESKWGVEISFKKPLSQFLGVNGQQSVIQTWFEERLTALRKYTDSSQVEFAWKVPKRVALID